LLRTHQFDPEATFTFEARNGRKREKADFGRLRQERALVRHPLSILGYYQSRPKKRDQGIRPWTPRGKAVKI
jgi:hypothetical protein